MKEDTNFKNTGESLDINFLPVDGEANTISDPLALFLQEIFIAMNLQESEVYGVSDSLNLQKYIFNKNISLNTIKQNIISYVTKHCSMSSVFQFYIDVNEIRENRQKIILITFKIQVPIRDSNSGLQYKEVLQKFLINY
ncbi:hypothetical protein EZS27_013086 [termite gut metagenome]|uniref:IraD/Gp25-like domain-containing protein n=1 Tax=termite gut metagenome TaxID=433724 RepID=A0A5J4RYN6_9ZZZZ